MMYDKQINNEQAKFGNKTAGPLIGTDRDDTCQIGMPIRVRKRLTINLQVSPVFVNGKRQCVIEAWMMKEHSENYSSSVNYVFAGPYPVNTRMRVLIPIAYGLIPTLKAHYEVLPRHSSYMLELLRKHKSAARFVRDIDKEIARHSKNNRKSQ